MSCPSPFPSSSITKKEDEYVEYEPYTWPFWSGTVCGILTAYGSLIEYGNLTSEQPIVRSVFKGLCKNNPFVTALFACGITYFVVGNTYHFLYPKKYFYKKGENKEVFSWKTNTQVPTESPSS